jgi:hypothetical protein
MPSGRRVSALLRRPSMVTVTSRRTAAADGRLRFAVVGRGQEESSPGRSR